MFLMGHYRALFVYFSSFRQQFYRKREDFSGIRTVIVEANHDDHLTICLAQI